LVAHLTDLTGVVGDHERAHDEVADLQGLHRIANLLHDADVLVPHRLVINVLNSPVGPQVRPADAGRCNPDDRIRRIDDLRVFALLDAHITGRLHQYSAHY
jgi:hypothetical protein